MGVMPPEEYTIKYFVDQDEKWSLKELAELIESATVDPQKASPRLMAEVYAKVHDLYQFYQEQLQDAREDYLYSGGDERVLVGSLI